MVADDVMLTSSHDIDYCSYIIPISAPDGLILKVVQDFKSSNQPLFKKPQLFANNKSVANHGCIIYKIPAKTEVYIWIRISNVFQFLNGCGSIRIAKDELLII